MSCEGVWSVEMKGLYGWERIGVAFLKNGEYQGGGPNHYSVGSYKEDGDTLKMSMTVIQFGEVRAIFGRKSKDNLQITSKCKIEKNKMTGTSKAKGINNFYVTVRLTRIGDLDS